MNAKEIAAALNGSQYPLRIPSDIAKGAKEAGLVIVYGASDDLMEFEGAIHEEVGANDGTTVFVDSEGILPEREQIEDDAALKALFAREPHSKAIEALWCKEGEYSFTYRTTIPHETFEVLEDGCPPYCRGIVFALSDVGKAAPAADGVSLGDRLSAAAGLLAGHGYKDSSAAVLEARDALPSVKAA